MNLNNAISISNQTNIPITQRLSAEKPSNPVPNCNISEVNQNKQMPTVGGGNSPIRPTIADRYIAAGDFAYKRMWWAKDICTYLPMILNGLSLAGSWIFAAFPISAAVVEFTYCTSRIAFYSQKDQQIKEIRKIAGKDKLAQKAINLLETSKKNAFITGMFEFVKFIGDITQVASIIMPPLYLLGLLIKVAAVFIEPFVSKQAKEVTEDDINGILNLTKQSEKNKECILGAFGFNKEQVKQLSDSENDTWNRLYIRNVLKNANIEVKGNLNNNDKTIFVLALENNADAIVDGAIYGTEAATVLQKMSGFVQNIIFRTLIYTYTIMDLWNNWWQKSKLNEIAHEIDKLEKDQKQNREALKTLKEKYEKKCEAIKTKLFIGSIKFGANTFRTLGQIILPALPMLNIVGVSIYLGVVFFEIYEWSFSKEKDLKEDTNELYTIEVAKNSNSRYLGIYEVLKM